MALRWLLSLLCLAVVSACRAPGAPPDVEALTGAEAGVELQPLVTGLDDPWGMDFLPDGNLLVTERGGAVLHVDADTWQARPLPGVPDSVAVGQGGMLDVLVAGGERGRGDAVWVYLAYVIEHEGGYTTRVARAPWRGGGSRGLDSGSGGSGGGLGAIEVLFTAEPAYSSGRHFGSRLVTDGDYLYFSVGDRGNRDYAQDLSRHNGKIMRLHADGRVPADNPFVGRPVARPEIWSYGHRNPQGLAWHPNGELWAVEHGPRGGDEINRIEPGKNYGWPVITYGKEYVGGSIGEGTHKAGMEQPVKYYVPSIAVCGAAFYSGDAYPGWGDSLLVAALVGTHLNQVALRGGGLGRERRLFTDAKLRFRDVQQGPDGLLYVLAGGDSLLRLQPATR